MSPADLLRFRSLLFSRLPPSIVYVIGRIASLLGCPLRRHRVILCVRIVELAIFPLVGP